MNSPKAVLSQFSEIYMFLVDYLSIRGEELPYYSKNATWNLFHAYVVSHSQILIDEYPGYGVKSISRLQSQYENMTFAEKSYIIKCFSKWCTKEGCHILTVLKKLIMLRPW